MKALPKKRKKKTKGYSEGESYAKWHTSNGQEYLEVFALDHYIMGKLEGLALGKKIRGLKRLIKTFTLRFKKSTRQEINWKLSEFEYFVPETQKREMQGMADAVEGISYHDILIQNCMMDVLHGHLMPKYYEDPVLMEYDFGCTVFGAINQNGPILGQNFDFGIVFKPYLSFVHSKIPNVPEHFSLRFGGTLNCPPARNSNGVTLAINLVKTNIKGQYDLPFCLFIRKCLENSQNTEDIQKLLEKEAGTFGYHLSAADKNNLISSEISPLEKNHQKIQNYFVRSNTYISKKFQRYLLKKGYSKKRQSYAENLLEEVISQKDKLSDKKLLEILGDRPIVCRINPLKSMTLCYFSKDHFGRGMAGNENHGIIPLP